MPIALWVGIGTVAAAIVSIVVLVGVLGDDATTTPRDGLAFIAAVGTFSLFYGTFFLPSLLSGNYIAPSDSLDFGVADYLSRTTLWSDGIWSGYPVAADPQALTWYPPMQVLRALGIDWNIFLISAYVIASATCFLLVRRLTRSTAAGAFSGFVCGFNALIVGYITNFNQIHAFAWVPLMLYGLQLIREGAHRRGASVTSFGTAMMWLAGHPQVPVYAMYLAAAVVVGTLIADRPPRTGALMRVRWSASALLLGCALAAIVLVPMIELGNYSPRSESKWELYSSSALPVREVGTLVAPFAFGGFWTEDDGIPYIGETGDSGYSGIVALALAAAAPLLVRRRRGDAWLWVIVGAVELLLALGPATPIGTLFYYAPGYSSFQAPLRHLFLVTLSISIAAGLTLAELDSRRRRLAALAIGGSAVVALVAFLAVQTIADARQLAATHRAYAAWATAWPLVPAIAAATLVMAASRLKRTRTTTVLFAVLLVGFEVADLTMVHFRLPGRRFEYADIVRTEAILRPQMAAVRRQLQQRGGRALPADGSKNPFLLPNLTRAWDVPSASGTGSLGLSYYLDVMGMDTSGAVSAASLMDANRGLDLFGVRYVLVPQDSAMAKSLAVEPNRWTPLDNLHYYESDPDTYYTLFENHRTLPHAWCVWRATQLDESQALQAIRNGQLADGATFDPTTTAVMDAPLPAAWSDHSPQHAEVTLDHPVAPRRLLVRTPDTCLLVIAEVFYPWWRAQIDGKSADVYRVNHAMIGVAVPPGSHVVSLALRPTSVWIGGTISIVSLVIAIVIVAGGKGQRRRAPTVTGAPVGSQ